VIAGATGSDGDVLTVDVKYCGIHFLVICYDGLTLYYDKKKPYMAVEAAIAWHEKELRESQGRSGNAKVLEALRLALENFKSGKVKVVDVPSKKVKPNG
jgi:hypothetical protein